MRKTSWIDEILLADSGELSPRRQRALERAVASDPELQKLRDQLRVTRDIARSPDDDTRVTDFTLEQIKAEAKRHRARVHAGQRPVTRPGVAAQWRPALVYAGISVLLLGVGALLMWQQPAIEQMAEVSAPLDAEPLVTAGEWDWLFEDRLAGLDDTLNELYFALDDVAWIANDEQAEEWARELLQREES